MFSKYSNIYDYTGGGGDRCSAGGGERSYFIGVSQAVSVNAANSDTFVFQWGSSAGDIVPKLGMIEQETWIAGNQPGMSLSDALNHLLQSQIHYVVSTDIVTAAGLAVLAHGKKRNDMVFHIKPIADIQLLE